MRKLTLVLLILVLMLPFATMISAQGEVVSCSVEEIEAIGEAVTIYAEALVELESIASDASDNNFGAALIGYDAFSYEFWNTLSPEFPVCAEAQTLTLIFGIAFDELAAAASFANIAGWAEALEVTEAAEYFVEAAAIRAESVTAMMEGMEDMEIEDMLSNLEACSVEEYEANTAVLEEYFAGLEVLFADLESTESNDIETLTGFVVVADTLSNFYWDEVYPELPACSEAEYDAYMAGAIVDELTLITSLGLNASLEDAAGNTEVAEMLLASATVRYEDLIAFLYEME